MSRKRKKPRPWLARTRPHPIVHHLGRGLAQTMLYAHSGVPLPGLLGGWGATDPVPVFLHDQWWRTCIAISMRRRLG